MYSSEYYKIRDNMSKTAEAVSTRLSEKEFEKIEKIVKGGYYINVSDFIRSAIREKLASSTTITIREADVQTAKKEILEYLKKNPVAFPSDIALELNMDLETVFQAVKELLEEKKVVE